MSSKPLSSFIGSEISSELEIQSPTRLEPTLAPQRERHNPLEAFHKLTAAYLDDGQFQELINMRGTNRELIVNIDDPICMIEILNLLGTLEPEAALKQLRDASKIDEDFVWSISSMDKTRDNFEYNYQLSKKKIQGTAYRGKCKRRGCKSVNFDALAFQMRSADEAATQIVTCLDCYEVFRA